MFEVNVAARSIESFAQLVARGRLAALEQTARLSGIGRLVIGVDYDPQTAIDAAHTWEPHGLRFAAMDGARIAARSRSIDWVCSSHIIEHFVAPE